MISALIKKYWLRVVVGIVALILTSFLTSLVSKIIYKKQIRELDANISELQKGIKDSKGKEKFWKESSQDNWKLAMEKEAKLRKKDKEMIVKIHEKRELQKKIKEMPATQVVIRTIEIINCPDVVKQEQGIVFSLNCAKKNLVVLENVFYFKKEALDWADQFFISQAEVSDLKNVIIGKNEAYAERGVQLAAAYEIGNNWEDKFNLSEKRSKSNWWKGLKTGSVLGAGIVILIKLVF